jgi:hypothetical protein
VKCPSCSSPAPHLHPTPRLCRDAFHLRPTRDNRPEWIARVKHMRRYRRWYVGRWERCTDDTTAFMFHIYFESDDLKAAQNALKKSKLKELELRDNDR